MVEGSVEAALMDSRALEVASGGYFTGTAVVDSAQIAGHFEGDLTVEGLLTLASTGRIIGTDPLRRAGGRARRDHDRGRRHRRHTLRGRLTASRGSRANPHQ